MYGFRIAWPALVASLALSVTGQRSGWLDGQINSTLCRWYDFRVATLKDKVYLDGGHLYWVPGMADGSLRPPVDDHNPLGLIGVLNFSTPFNTSMNASTLFSTISKAPNGGAANNFAPNYYGGALLANNDEFYLYGGATIDETNFAPPEGDQVLGYMASQYGDNGQSFQAGFLNVKLPEDVTRYVTYGGGVNVPSENKAWYFGGLRTESWGQIYDNYDNATYTPTNISNSFVKLDMTTQQQEEWSNVTLPRGIPSRAGPSVVWVPVGEQGILVVLGGVTYPSFTSNSGDSANPEQNKQDSPGFMANIDIYDIAGDTWYQQQTIGSPSQYALGCAVVATAQDYSSFNIYYYGGYDAISEDSDMNDDVWILSLPSFMWMKVTSAMPGHGRAGHQCVMPYPDQMITIGGRASGGPEQCLEGDPPEFLQVYNLTSGRWMDSYDPESWNEYGVPEMIHMMIGGDYSGGATITTPTPSGWATPELASVFATPYPTTKLSTYYPYSTVGAGNSTRGELDSNGGGGGTPSWIGPVLGVVLGLIFITAIVVAVLLYRRRKLLKKKAGSDHSTENNRVESWVREQQDGKTVTTEDTHTQLDEMESRGITPMRSPPGQPEMRQYTPSEMPDTPLVELPDNSLITELPGYDMKHPHFTSAPQTPQSIFTPTSQTFLMGGASQDHASSTSGPITSSLGQINERPDSPSLGNSERSFNNIASITNSTSNVGDNYASTSGPQVSPPLPVSPPSVIVDGPSEATDYISVHRDNSSATNTGSPLRRSVFRESENDLGEERDGNNQR